MGPALGEHGAPAQRRTGQAGRLSGGGDGGPGQYGISDLLLSVPGPHQDLEQKLFLQEQDSAIVKNMKAELVRLPKMERELKQLKEENAYLR